MPTTSMRMASDLKSAALGKRILLWRFRRAPSRASCTVRMRTRTEHQ